MGPLRLDAVVRVSRVMGRGGESFYSPGEQRRAIERYCAAKGYEVAAVFEDLDQSGGTIERPGLQAAMARVEAGESDGIVVHKIDRFARSVRVQLEAIERVHGAGGVFRSAAEDFDLATSNGRFIFQVLGAMAEREREQAKEGWAVAKFRAIERGAFPARTPVGYARDHGRLVPHPDQAPVVRELFHRRASGASWSELARWLTEAIGPKHGVQWAANSVRNIVKNRVYLGETRHGDILRTGTHAALLSEDEFRAAQGSRPVGRPSGDVWLLVGARALPGLPLQPAPGAQRSRTPEGRDLSQLPVPSQAPGDGGLPQPGLHPGRGARTLGHGPPLRAARSDDGSDDGLGRPRGCPTAGRPGRARARERLRPRAQGPSARPRRAVGARGGGGARGRGG